jgi:hypothetical protein
MWSLLRIWHIEALESVIGDPKGVSFTRTSYVAAPARWRNLSQPELAGRIEQLLNAAYERRNWLTTQQSGDPVGLEPFVFYFEWVERDSIPAAPGVVVEPWVLPRANAHPDLVARAFAEIDARVQAARPGIDARAYADAFYVFRIDEDDSWHFIRSRSRKAETLFAERFEE